MWGQRLRQDQIHKCKEMGGKRQTPHGQAVGGRGTVLGRGVLEQACWGEAKGKAEKLALPRLVQTLGITAWCGGSAQGSSGESMVVRSWVIVWPVHD